MPPLRAVFLTHSYPRFSGDAAGSFLLTLAQALASQNIQVDVIAPAARDLAPYELLDSIPVHRFRYAPRAWEKLAYTGTMAETVSASLAGKVALAGFMVGQGLALRRLVRRLRADVVHAHWWFPAGVVARRAALARPYVLTLHGSDVRLATQRRWAHPLFRSVLRRAAAVTAVSSWLADETRRILPTASPLVSPMPVNVDSFHPSRSGRASDEVLFVGRLNEQKGLRYLLEAIAASRRRPRLTVVGDGPDARVLQAHAVTLGIADRVTWHGALAQPQLMGHYQRATVVAIPSLQEGLGLVAVEAQLCETPVVAFASGGLNDLISHGETGLLVPPRDFPELAAALDRVLDEPQLAASLGTAGRHRALTTFSPAAAAARYADLYRRVAARLNAA